MTPKLVRNMTDSDLFDMHYFLTEDDDLDDDEFEDFNKIKADEKFTSPLLLILYFCYIPFFFGGINSSRSSILHSKTVHSLHKANTSNLVISLLQ